MSVLIAHIMPGMSIEDRRAAEVYFKKRIEGIEFASFDTIQEVFPKLSDPNFNPNYIVVDIEHFYSCGIDVFDIVSTLKTLIGCTVYRPEIGKPMKRNTKILGVVGETTNPKLVRSIIKLVDGIAMRIGQIWTIDEIVKDMKKFTSGDLSMPRPVQKLLREKKLVQATEPGIVLTNRQQQIFDIVMSRGCSNKHVARILGLSESTVKLHMSAILKKYGVKNRTQLAVFSRAV